MLTDYQKPSESLLTMLFHLPPRLLMTIEEHGAGKQLARFQIWPKYSLMAIALPLICLGFSIIAGFDHARVACTLLAALALLLAVRAFRECADATGGMIHALSELKSREFGTCAVGLEQPSSENISHAFGQTSIARKDTAKEQPNSLEVAAVTGGDP